MDVLDVALLVGDALDRAGGEVSDRQWRDVVEVLRHSGAQIDESYLDEWAGRLGVAELPARARREAAGTR